ncbi:AraC family transcriptional regulator [bacterium]|nr:AraC family transcriptional regulator [bacterium]
MIYNLKSSAERITSRIEIDKVIEYLHFNYGQKISVEEMARAALLSPSHFASVFKKETGRSPMDYLIALRLNKAKKFLRAGGKTITEIALECGFASSSHFSSCFRQEFAITPSEFKKMGHRSTG